MSDLMSIGEFATATWLSPKALRLYDRRGLLSPDTVDPVTGYRRYSDAQIDRARLISMLRRIDMSLEQIGDLLATPPGDREAYLARFRRREAELHARRQSLSRYLERTMVGGGVGARAREGLADIPGHPDAARFEVSVQSVPDTGYVTSTRHTSARGLPEVIRSGAEALFALADERGGASGGLVVIYHGEVGWESDGPVEICVPLRETGRAHRVEAAHTQLVVHVPPEDVQFPGILSAFDAVGAHARLLGRAPSGPPREIYSPEAEESMPRCEVALPVHQNESGEPA